MTECVYEINVEDYINKSNEQYIENNVCEIREMNKCEDDSNSI